MKPGRRKFAALTVLSLLLNGCGSNEPIKLGFIASQTGLYAELGSAGMRGAILATEWRNAAGGVRGRPVTLLIRDDEFDTARAKSQMQSLLDAGVVAVVGPMTSSIAAEIIPLANASETVLMGATVAASAFSGHDDYFFRIIMATTLQAPITARAHARLLAPRLVSVIYDLANIGYTGDWTKAYAAEMSHQGAKQVAQIGFDSRSPQDLSAAVRKALEGGPDLVTLVCSPSTNTQLLRELHHIAPPHVRYAAAGWGHTPQLLADAGSAAEGLLVEAFYDPDSSSPRLRKFSEAYFKRFNRVPDYAAASAFDATTVVLEALEQDPTRKGLRAVLLRQRKFEGLEGDIVFDKFGDTTRPIRLAEVHQGRPVLLPERP